MTTITIDGFSASDPVPGFYGQTLTGQGQQSASSIPLLILVCGIMGAGSANANQAYPITSAEDADTYFGAGSQAARQCYSAIAGGQGEATLFAVGIPAAGGATQAVSLINIGGTWSTGGQFNYRINGQTRSVTVNAGDTLADAAANIAADINSQPRWPVTATSAVLGSTGTYQVTVKHKTAGLGGNQQLLAIDTSQAPSGFEGSVLSSWLGTATYGVWAANTVYAVGAAVAGSTPGGTAGLFYVATIVSGSATSGSVHPSWPSVTAGTVVDNSDITWTAATVVSPANNWQAATYYPVGAMTQPTVANGYFYRATSVTSGLSSLTTQPSWPVVVGSTVVDYGVTWTCEGVVLTGGIVPFVNGTGTESVTAALEAILTRQYDRIAPAQNDATNVALWDAQVDAQAGPTTNILGQLIFATNGIAAAAQTLAQTTLNDARAQVLNELNSETHPCEIAAFFGAARESLEGANPDQGYDDYPLGSPSQGGVAPQSQAADSPNHAALVLALNNGVTAIYTPAGKALISRCITSYSLNGSVPDYAARDTNQVTVPDQFRQQTRLDWTQYKAANPVVEDDPATSAAGQLGAFPPSGVGMPSTWNAIVYGRLKEWEAGRGFPYPQIEEVDQNLPVSGYSDAQQCIMSAIPIVPTPIQHQVGVSVRGTAP